MTLYLITKTMVYEHQMLVEAAGIVEAQRKALEAGPEHWRELEPRELWTAEGLQADGGEDGEEGELPEVVR